MDWLTANWPGVVVAVGAAIALAEAITRLTPTPKDDKFVSKVRRVYERLTGKQR